MRFSTAIIGVIGLASLAGCSSASGPYGGGTGGGQGGGGGPAGTVPLGPGLQFVSAHNGSQKSSRRHDPGPRLHHLDLDRLAAT